MNEEHRAIFNSISLENQVFDIHWHMSTPRPLLRHHFHNTRHQLLWNEVKSFERSPHNYTHWCNDKLMRPLLVTWQMAWSVFFACLCLICTLNSNSSYFISQECFLNRPFAAKPSRDLLFIKLWAATLRMPEMEKACRKHQNGQVWSPWH